MKDIAASAKAQVIAGQDVASVGATAVNRLDTLVDLAGYSAEALGHLAAVSELYLPDIASELTRVTGFLDGISEMIAAPAETAAKEKARWGLQNLGRGYHEEAEHDLSASLELYPYDGAVHLALGICLSSSGDVKRLSDATAAYRAAVRYARGESPRVLAAGALLAHNILKSTGQTSQGTDLLRTALDEVPDAPDLWLAFAASTKETAALTRALELDPSLVTVALGAGLEVGPAIDATVAGWTDKLVPLSQACEQARAVLVEVSPHLPPPPPVVLQGAEPADRLLEASALRKSLPAYLGRLDAEARKSGTVAAPSSSAPAPPANRGYNPLENVGLAAMWGWVPGLVVAVAYDLFRAHPEDPMHTKVHIFSGTAFVVVWAGLVGVALIAAVLQASASASSKREYNQLLSLHNEKAGRAEERLAAERTRRSEAAQILNGAESVAEGLVEPKVTRPFVLGKS